MTDMSEKLICILGDGSMIIIQHARPYNYELPGPLFGEESIQETPPKPPQQSSMAVRAKKIIALVSLLH